MTSRKIEKMLPGRVLVKVFQPELVAESKTSAGIILPGNVEIDEKSQYQNIPGLINTESAEVLESGVEALKKGDTIAVHHNVEEYAKTTGRTIDGLSVMDIKDDGIYAITTNGQIKAMPGFIIAEPIPNEYEKRGSIFISAKPGSKPNHGKVRSSGVDYVEDGATIVFDSYGHVTLKIHGKVYWRFKEHNVLGEGEFISDEKLIELQNEQNRTREAFDRERESQREILAEGKEKALGEGDRFMRKTLLAEKITGKRTITY